MHRRSQQLSRYLTEGRGLGYQVDSAPAQPAAEQVPHEAQSTVGWVLVLLPVQPRQSDERHALLIAPLHCSGEGSDGLCSQLELRVAAANRTPEPGRILITLVGHSYYLSGRVVPDETVILITLVGHSYYLIGRVHTSSREGAARCTSCSRRERTGTGSTSRTSGPDCSKPRCPKH